MNISKDTWIFTCTVYGECFLKKLFTNGTFIQMSISGTVVKALVSHGPLYLIKNFKILGIRGDLLLADSKHLSRDFKFFLRSAGNIRNQLGSVLRRILMQPGLWNNLSNPVQIISNNRRSLSPFL
jgi:hypothetical protein